MKKTEIVTKGRKECKNHNVEVTYVAYGVLIAEREKKHPN
jgi:hypothetical protein